MAHERRCMALADWGCAGSQACREDGRCVAIDGLCDFHPDEPVRR
jgi:hypothetical protein